MTLDSMVLKVILPFEILLEKDGVNRIVVETTKGSIGLLPLRLDCVAFLIPGIMVYEAQGEEEKYVAASEGILVKKGPLVTVSLRNGTMGSNLELLQKTAKDEFLKGLYGEQRVIRTVGKLESVFLHHLIEGVYYG